MSGSLFFGKKSIIGACLTFSLLSCEETQESNTLFYKVPSSQSNIIFENTLTNSDDFNIIEYLYFYNGGGVAIGDINNDGLPDIYFSSNQLPNKLYLNKGNLEFEDITSKAGVAGIGNWKTGVTMADVNGDGFLDIFVCGVGNYKKFNGQNQLFVNNGDLTFTDKTDEYGLSFQGFSTQASFFDYDNDGDLDMYLANHAVHTIRSYGHAMLRFQSDPLAGDKLYQNELLPGGQPHFKEVTSQAGILNSQIGYGLGVGVSDFNRDGYLDIYVSNDFNENDYLYMNQGNGTFRQEVERSIPHSSRFSMGNDIADVNNDGLTDLFTLDMLPRDEGVIKTTAGEDAYEIYEFKLRYGYHYQVARNTLQLNRGLDSKKSLMFSDIGPLAGVEATDWSWAPLLADFNNDGYKDLFVANGILGRPNDMDYINYISSDSAQRYFTDQQLFNQMPDGKVPNVFFQNNGDLTFVDVSDKWIGNSKSLSNGAAYADLDNDGDLDLVVNNINEKAFIYRNDISSDFSRFLKIKLEGERGNKFGVGTKVIVHAGDREFFYEQIPTRGWLSSVDYLMHVGLGKSIQVDSVSIYWPGNKSQTFRTVQTNTTLVAKQSDAHEHVVSEIKGQMNSLLLEKNDAVAFKHQENTFIPFSAEALIPHMISTQGPKISVGDINGDGRDDFFVGGASGQAGAIFIQDGNGHFRQSLQSSIESDSLAEDVASAFFDADGNETLDLIVVSGGQEFSGDHKNLLPRLYLNNGKGNFKKATGLPDIFLNASCVKPGDVDNDGDIDLFIGGRVVSGRYGVDPPSFILLNDGYGVFKDTGRKSLPDANSKGGPLGMVTDAIWIDVNKDNRLDLAVVGEWMPITILVQNDSGSFENKTQEYGFTHTNGWWNTIAAHDFDNDGDLDFIAGNLGLNSRIRATLNEPVSIYIGDIDKNNSLDHILTYYNQGKRYPLVSRDQLVKQVPSLKKKFLKYSNFRNVIIDDIIEPQSLRDEFIRKDAFTFASIYAENLGNGKFIIKNLPVQGQMFPIFSFCIDDINLDGYADVLAIGNLYDTQPDFGRYDAGYGLALLGDGKGNFEIMPSQSTGFVVNGQGRDIKSLATSQTTKLFVVALNNDSLKVFQRTKK